MKIIKTILTSGYFLDNPPILVDIGASGEINKKWEIIAPHSVCIAFDADDRDFQINEVDSSIYKKLIIFNRIVIAEENAHPNFFLTVSPYCSSLLKPDEQKLKPWVFCSLFDVEKVTTLPAITLKEALSQTSVDYVDWFKTDTQGTDLRLFKSLPTMIAENVLMAEFEPGIIDAYQGEDKLYMVMQEMRERDFWLSSMDIKGTQRLDPNYVSIIGEFKTKRVIRKSPCWAEVTYLRQPFPGNQRQLLLLIVFALLEKQYGFALEVIDYSLGRFNDPLFRLCKKAVLTKLSQEKWKVPLVIMKRQFNKLLSKIHD